MIYYFTENTETEAIRRDASVLRFAPFHVMGFDNVAIDITRYPHAIGTVNRLWIAGIAVDVAIYRHFF